MSTNKIKNIKQLDQVKKSTMWTGSQKRGEYNMFVLNKKEIKNEEGVIDIVKSFEQETCKFAPAWYKIIDEIIVNAIDQWVKYPKEVKTIKITFDIETGALSVQNDGPSIGVYKDKTVDGRNMYIAQMAASDFNTSSNYDVEKRYTGGVNGAGLKLTNAYSDWLEVETVDTKRRLHFYQRFEDRLEVICNPIVRELEEEEYYEYTRVTFMPSYETFGYESGYKSKYGIMLSKLVEIRAYQAAIYTDAKVYYNKQRIKFNQKNKFIEFAEMYLNNQYGIWHTTLLGGKEDRSLELCIGISNGKSQQVTIANGLNVYGGGNHIKHLQDQIVMGLRPLVEKKLKSLGGEFNSNFITNNLFIFVLASFPNLDFDSQTKSTITNPKTEFTNYKLTEKEMKTIWKFAEPHILSSYSDKYRDKEKLKVVRGQMNIYKCVDAQWAGKKAHSKKAIMFIVEGDSAKGTIHSGIVNKDTPLNYTKCGWFIIGGVPMNARKKCEEIVDEESGEKVIMRNTKLQDNERWRSLVEVLGLDFTKKYDPDTEEGEVEFNTLRYGKVIVAVDQDVDGKGFIYGQIINFFVYFWPNLLRWNFICRFNTPIIRAFGKQRTAPVQDLINTKFGKENIKKTLQSKDKIKKESVQVKEFYSIVQYKNWIENEFKGNDESAKKKYTIRYYKGLGTHEKRDIPHMFKKYEDQLIYATADDDAEKNLEIYFGHDTDVRKKVLRTPPEDFDFKSNHVPVSYILKTDIKEFARDKIARSLPSAIDGLTESRRKILWTARHQFGKTATTNRSMKIAALAAKATEFTSYHHGEQCMANTIQLMAQNFSGSNNLPMLNPHGQFGTRQAGGKDAASPRYTFTTLNQELCYSVFPDDDDYLLDFVFDEGDRCEPKYFVPIIPMAILENMCGNIGVGWKATIWSRDIYEVIDNIRNMINGKIKKAKSMSVWLNSNIGEIRKHDSKYYSIGKYKYNKKDNTIQITELPMGVYPLQYHGIQKESKDDGKKTKSKKKAGAKPDRKNTQLWQKPEFKGRPLDNTDESVDITFYLKDENSWKVIQETVAKEPCDSAETYLNLKNVLTSHLNMINHDDCIIEFKKYEQVFNNWFEIRKTLYTDRIDRQLILLKLYILYLKNLIRFQKERQMYGWTEKTPEDIMIEKLENEEYQIFDKELLMSPKFTQTNDLKELILRGKSASYNYLLDLRIRDLAEGACKKRMQQLKEKENDLDELKTLAGKGKFCGAALWERELDKLEKIITNGVRTGWSNGNEDDYSYE